LTEYLDLADYLLIAEAVLRVPAEEVARWPGIGLADSALHAPAAGFGAVELYRICSTRPRSFAPAWLGTIRSRTGTSGSPTSRCSSSWPETESTGRHRRWMRPSRRSNASPPGRSAERELADWLRSTRA
jgi:hypothetical protein